MTGGPIVKPSRRIIAVSISILWLAGVAGAADVEEGRTVVSKAPCCFENPRYSGTCKVVPGPEESCGDILAYLNNPNSVGKNYCGNTKVRGGWVEVSCEEAASTPTSTSCQVSVPRE
jgi:hypothetical protein